MSKLFHPFWATFTFIITLIFIITFYPEIRSHYGMLKAIIYTATGASIIWLVYYIRHGVYRRMLATFYEEDEE